MNKLLDFLNYEFLPVLYKVLAWPRCKIMEGVFHLYVWDRRFRLGIPPSDTRKMMNKWGLENVERNSKVSYEHGRWINFNNALYDFLFITFIIHALIS